MSLVFDSDSVLSGLVPLYEEPTLLFHAMVKAAGFDPRIDFKNRDLRGMVFADADLDGFNFAGSDLRGTGVRKAAHLGTVVLDEAKLDPADRAWLRRKVRARSGAVGVWGQSRWGDAAWGSGEEVALLGTAELEVGRERGEKGRGPWPPRVALAVWRETVPGLPEFALPEMVTLPGGDFRMGAPAKEKESYKNERPRRLVYVPSFALGRCAVTFGQWDAARAAGADLREADDRGWGKDDRPVINVSWHDAQAYCAWLNGRLGLQGAYRLPTEAEWEYACRAGTKTPFSFGATISTVQANYDGNDTYGEGQKGEDRAQTVPVGSLPGNDWGLHEMHGNVLEWVEDVYRDNYKNAPLDGSQAVTGEEAALRVLRGGSWYDFPSDLRSAYRDMFTPDYRFNDVGFRLARTL